MLVPLEALANRDSKLRYEPWDLTQLTTLLTDTQRRVVQVRWLQTSRQLALNQPEAFASVFHSLWWAVASFTTVGYGDMVPITAGGRIFTAFVLFLGLGIMAVPAAIVTTALLEAETNIRKRKQFKPPKPDDNNTETE